MNANETLDFILGVIYKRKTNNLEVPVGHFKLSQLFEDIKQTAVHNYLNDKTSTLIDYTQYTEVINKLTKDGYLSQVVIPMHNIPTETYVTTFEGRWFVESGGYTRKAFREKVTTTFRLFSSILIAVGALVASVYYLHELLKSSGVSVISGMTYVYMGISACISIAVLWLLLQREAK